MVIYVSLFLINKKSIFFLEIYLLRLYSISISGKKKTFIVYRLLFVES